MKLYAPLTLQMKVGVIHRTDPNIRGDATFTFGHDGLPTLDGYRKALAKVEQQIGDEMRLMTKTEWFNHVIEASTGHDTANLHIAIPGGSEWTPWPDSGHEFMDQTVDEQPAATAG